MYANVIYVSHYCRERGEDTIARRLKESGL